MDREVLIKVFDQVQKSMVSLASSSGHLVSYSLVPDTFKITKEESGENETRYYFTARAFRESEFTVYDNTSPSVSEVISGSLVLDNSFDLVRDEQGRIMLEPWTCIETPMQTQSSPLRTKVKKQLLEKLHAAERIIASISEECGFNTDAKINSLLTDIQTRLSGAKISSNAVLQHAYLEDIYINMVVGIMDQDMLAPEDEIVVLIKSIEKRIDNFDLYFEKLERNELEKPFMPKP